MFSKIKMVCVTSCAIASALLGGMVWIHLNTNEKTMYELKDTLDPKQKEIYSWIVQNRLRIWFTGLAWGVALGVAWLMFSKMQNLQRNCIFSAIVMGVNYVYYMVAPKGTYLIKHLDESQYDEWKNVKVMMQRNYTIGLVLGLVGCYFLSDGISN